MRLTEPSPADRETRLHCAAFADPETLFRDGVVITAPHMDDGVLACGGTIAQLGDKRHVHFVYATDGASSPVPAFPRRRSPPPGLTDIRMAEARDALGLLGVPEDNIHFLGLPDGGLRSCMPRLSDALAELVDRLQPIHLLAPFRYDRHPDHLALNRAAVRALRGRSVLLLEYFVYHRWRLLPSRDVRSYVDPDQLVSVDIRSSAGDKRSALECFTTQTTRYYDWQDRPVLTAQTLDEACGTPERFLRFDPAWPGATIFPRHRLWIRVAHVAEPVLKNAKDQVIALTKWGLTRRDRSTR